MPTADELFDDNIHVILQESALKESCFSIFDFAESDKPEQVKKIVPEDDTLKSLMVESIEEIEKSEEGEIKRFEDQGDKSCQTFSLPTKTKLLFEKICENNYTTPSCFLRNVCQRLVDSYYGK